MSGQTSRIPDPESHVSLSDAAQAVQPGSEPPVLEPPAPAGGIRVGKANWSPDYHSDRSSFIRRLTNPLPAEPTASDSSTSPDAGMVSGEISERAVSLSSDETPASDGGVRELATAPPVPRTFVVEGGGHLPDGQFLIDVWSDGVTLAWRPNSYGSTLWGVPVDAIADPYDPAELARKARPLTDNIGRGTRP